jgi:alkylation response protein AidB-like acyl-CoA dehydrogenase
MSLFGASHEAFRLEVRQFVAERLSPFATEWEARAQLPRSVFEEFGARGYLGLTRTPTHGGRGLDFGYGVVLAEEVVGCRMGGLSLSVLAQANFFLPLLERYGTEAQKREFLAPAIRGERIGALASTEPAGGSDISGATSCRAEDAGDFWIISGEKKYITNGPIADFVVTLVRTRGGGGPNGLSPVSYTHLTLPTKA